MINEGGGGGKIRNSVAIFALEAALVLVQDHLSRRVTWHTQDSHGQIIALAFR